MALADTSAIAIGFGTIASRSTVTLSAAIHYASEPLREKVFAIAANMLECAPGDLELRDGSVGVVGVPGMEVTLASDREGGAAGLGPRPPAGHRCRARGDLLLRAARRSPGPMRRTPRSSRSTSSSGSVTIEKYAIAHDCGVVVNPMLVEGQVIGGAVQGLGGALLEEFAYDARGPARSPARSWTTCCRRASDVPAHAI